jgi:hypothetical protein
MIARQHRQAWREPLGALADPFKVIVEPRWLTSY